MSYYVYVLRSQRDGELYIGFTTDLKRRIAEHLRGGVQSTKFRLPMTLLHYEFFINRWDAEARETFLKSGAGHAQLHDKLKRTFQQTGKSSGTVHFEGGCCQCGRCIKKTRPRKGRSACC